MVEGYVVVPFASLNYFVTVRPRTPGWSVAMASFWPLYTSAYRFCRNTEKKSSASYKPHNTAVPYFVLNVAIAVIGYVLLSCNLSTFLSTNSLNAASFAFCITFVHLYTALLYLSIFSTSGYMLLTSDGVGHAERMRVSIRWWRRKAITVKR